MLDISPLLHRDLEILVLWDEDEHDWHEPICNVRGPLVCRNRVPGVASKFCEVVLEVVLRDVPNVRMRNRT